MFDSEANVKNLLSNMTNKLLNNGMVVLTYTDS